MSSSHYHSQHPETEIEVLVTFLLLLLLNFQLSENGSGKMTLVKLFISELSSAESYWSAHGHVPDPTSSFLLLFKTVLTWVSISY